MDEESAERVVFIVCLAVVITAIDALALLLIWRWHVVGVFHAPALTFLRAFAIVVMVRLFLIHSERTVPRGPRWRSDVARLAFGRVWADLFSVGLAYGAWVLS